MAVRKIDYFKKYQKETKDIAPFNGNYPDCPGNTFRVWRNGKRVKATKEEYDADFRLVHEHYSRYKHWMVAKAKELIMGVGGLIISDEIFYVPKVILEP